MTDEEYIELLKALAAKHLRHPGPEWPYHFPPHSFPGPMTLSEYLRWSLRKLSSTNRLLKVVQDRPGDVDLLQRLSDELKESPVRVAAKAMTATGILSALDDAPQIVFDHLRRTAIPREDIEFLMDAGFTQAEIDVLLAIAINTAPRVATATQLPSDIAYEAASELEAKLSTLTEPTPDGDLKKGRWLNGIGKLLGGALAGLGNALLWTGTIAAPNPATAYTAIASGGLAISTIFAGLGDLRGE